MTVFGYDIIGDIHGHADALRRLLIRLGYSEVGGSFQRPDRKVVFVGDFVDRGPEQAEVLRIARAMCDAGSASAVLGNHEFNAIAWATPDGKGGFLRPHSDKNGAQHKEFLSQIGDGSAQYHDAIGWFRSLPVWAEFDGFRVVHACWHEASRAALSPHVDRQARFTQHGLHAALERGSGAYVAAEILLKGPEAQLPAPVSFVDEDGNERDQVRLVWWRDDATTFRRAAYGLDDQREALPDVQLAADFRYRDSTPVFFGHYWMNGEPTLTSPSAACLDFSVAKEGYLTAYRWSGESQLSSDHIEYVSAAGL